MPRSRTNSSVKRSLKADEGFALVAVLGVSALLTVVAIASFAMAQQSLHESERMKDESRAFQAANGGMDAVLARIAVEGLKPSNFPTTFPTAQLGVGSASVTITETAPGDFIITSRGMAPDGTTELVRVRLYVMDIYGMNIAYGSGFNQGSAAGNFNGNASIAGPFYTYKDLRQGDNLGQSSAGGFWWGPIYIKSGTLDVKSDYLKDVMLVYVDPAQPDPKVVVPPTRVVRSVPKIVVPRVDSEYLQARYDAAFAESADNLQGEPRLSPPASNEVTRANDPTSYTATRCPQARPSYKVIDNDGTKNKSLVGGLTIGADASFGHPDHDFAWNATTRVLTVRGTVFVDGPLNFVGGAIRYQGNGTIVVNGDVRFTDADFTPVGGLLPGQCPDGVVRENQLFDPGAIIGISTPGRIIIEGNTNSNAKNPDGAPTHAGAFFADQSIVITRKTMLVGSIISQGIDVEGNNNMDMRTSPNLGQNVPKSMPGVDVSSKNIAIWARR